MGIKACLLVAALALRVLASPVEVPPSPVKAPQPANDEGWTLLYFRRACVKDQSRCDYSFLVSEDPAKAPQYCRFPIDATADDGLPAYQVGFSLAKCPEAPEYSVNGGWDERGFVTVTIINDERGLLSFFAFKDEELVNGTEAVPQRSKVFDHPMPVKRESIPEVQEGSLAYAPEWKLLGVIRYLVNQGSPDLPQMMLTSFTIEGGGAPAESCIVHVELAAGDKPMHKSFYDRECSTGGWRVSWGLNEATDEAVMTLVNKNHDRHAFFGFNNVSKNILLGPSGPNPTRPL